MCACGLNVSYCRCVCLNIYATAFLKSSQFYYCFAVTSTVATTTRVETTSPEPTTTEVTTVKTSTPTEITTASSAVTYTSSTTQGD